MKSVLRQEREAFFDRKGNFDEAHKNSENHFILHDLRRQSALGAGALAMRKEREYFAWDPSDRRLPPESVECADRGEHSVLASVWVERNPPTKMDFLFSPSSRLRRTVFALLSAIWKLVLNMKQGLHRMMQSLFISVKNGINQSFWTPKVFL